VALTLLFIYGMWFGIVHRRWSLPGTVTFIAAQVSVLLAVGLLITWGHAWPGTGRFFSTLSAAGLTGLLAVLAATLLAGGYATVRRVTV
jgi:undecaprenyl pyrophosphate phosphatase UppP